MLCLFWPTESQIMGFRQGYAMDVDVQLSAQYNHHEQGIVKWFSV